MIHSLLPHSLSSSLTFFLTHFLPHSLPHPLSSSLTHFLPLYFFIERILTIGPDVTLTTIKKLTDKEIEIIKKGKKVENEILGEVGEGN